MDQSVLLSAEQLLKLGFDHLQLLSLQLLRKTPDVQDRLVSLVEQLFAHFLLHPVPPGAQLRVALKHIHAGSNRLQDNVGNLSRAYLKVADQTGWFCSPA